MNNCINKKLFLSLMFLLLFTSYSMGTNHIDTNHIDTKNKIQISKEVRAGYWTTNYESALAESAKTGKPLYILFTGSDWCGPCIIMEKKIYTQKEWKEFATENLILVYLDFPRKKQQDETLKEKSKELKKKYNIKSFPRFFLIMGKEEKITRISLERDSDKFILNKFMIAVKNSYKQATE